MSDLPMFTQLDVWASAVAAVGLTMLGFFWLFHKWMNR